MDTMQLDTLKITMGNDLATLVAFLGEMQHYGQRALWRQDDSALSQSDILRCLGSTGWQTTSSPQVILKPEDEKSYLIVRSKVLYETHTDARVYTICMTRRQWQALSDAHANDDEFAWLAQLKNVNGSESADDVVSLTGTSVIEEHVSMLIQSGGAQQANFVYVDGQVSRREQGSPLPPLGLPLTQAAFVEQLLAASTTSAFAYLRKELVFSGTKMAEIRGAVLAEAGKKLAAQGELVWALYSAMSRAAPSVSYIEVDIDTNALKAALFAVGSALAEKLPADKTRISVARTDIVQMVVRLRENIPALLSALLMGELASLPSGDGLQLVNMSDWLGSALYSGGEQSGLFRVLRQEGFDPSVETLLPAATATKGDLAKLTGDLVHTATQTLATAETIRSWISELSRGGSYRHDAYAMPIWAPSVLLARPARAISVLAAADRKRLDDEILAIKDGIEKLTVFAQKLPEKADLSDQTDRMIGTGIAAAALASDATIAAIEKATQTRHAAWKMKQDTTNTLISESEVAGLLTTAGHALAARTDAQTIDILHNRKIAAVTLKSDWIVLSDSEADGEALLGAINANMAVYTPLAEKDLANAKLGTPAWIVDNGVTKLAAKAETIDYWEASLQIGQDAQEALFVKDQLDFLRPDDDATPVDLGVWTGDGSGVADRLFAQTERSGAMVPTPKTFAAFDASALGEAQLVANAADGKMHLLVSRETLDGWSTQLAMHAAMAYSALSGDAEAWQGAFMTLAAPSYGRTDITRIRAIYVNATLTRSIIWYKKDLTLEQSRVIQDLMFAPVEKALSRILAAAEVSVKSEVVQYGLERKKGWTGDQVPTWEESIQFQAEQSGKISESVAASVADEVNKLQAILERNSVSLASLRDEAGNQLIDTEKLKVSGDTILAQVAAACQKTPVPKRASLNVRLDAVSKSFASVVKESISPALTTLQATKNNILGKFADKVAYYDRIKEGIQATRVIGATLLGAWVVSTFALAAKADKEGKSLEAAYNAIFGLQLAGQAAHMAVWIGGGMIDAARNNAYLVRRNDELFRRAFRQAYGNENVWDAYMQIQSLRDVGRYGDAVDKQVGDEALTAAVDNWNVGYGKSQDAISKKAIAYALRDEGKIAAVLGDRKALGRLGDVAGPGPVDAASEVRRVEKHWVLAGDSAPGSAEISDIVNDLWHGRVETYEISATEYLGAKPKNNDEFIARLHSIFSAEGGKGKGKENYKDANLKELVTELYPELVERVKGSTVRAFAQRVEAPDDSPLDKDEWEEIPLEGASAAEVSKSLNGYVLSDNGIYAVIIETLSPSSMDISTVRLLGDARVNAPIKKLLVSYIKSPPSRAPGLTDAEYRDYLKLDLQRAIDSVKRTAAVDKSFPLAELKLSANDLVDLIVDPKARARLSAVDAREISIETLGLQPGSVDSWKTRSFWNYEAVRYNDTVDRVKTYVESVDAGSWGRALADKAPGSVGRVYGEFADRVMDTPGQVKSAFAEFEGYGGQILGSIRSSTRFSLTELFKTYGDGLDGESMAAYADEYLYVKEINPEDGSPIGYPPSETHPVIERLAQVQGYPFREEVSTTKTGVPLVSKRASMQFQREIYWGPLRYSALFFSDFFGFLAPALGLANDIQKLQSATGDAKLAIGVDIARQVFFFSANTLLTAAHIKLAMTKAPVPNSTAPTRALSQGYGAGLSAIASVIVVGSELANIYGASVRLIADKDNPAYQNGTYHDYEAKLSIAGSAINISLVVGSTALALMSCPLISEVFALGAIFLPNFGEIGRSLDLLELSMQLRQKGLDHDADITCAMSANAARAAVPVSGWFNWLREAKLFRGLTAQGEEMEQESVMWTLQGLRKTATADWDPISGLDAGTRNVFQSAWANFPNYVVPLNPYLGGDSLPGGDGSFSAWNYGLDNSAWKTMAMQSAKFTLARIVAQSKNVGEAGYQNWCWEAIKERGVSKAMYVEPTRRDLGGELRRLHQAALVDRNDWLHGYSNIAEVKADLDKLGGFVRWWDEVNGDGRELFGYVTDGPPSSLLDFMATLGYSRRDILCVQYENLRNAQERLDVAAARSSRYDKAIEEVNARNPLQLYLSELDGVLLPNFKEALGTTDLFVLASREDAVSTGLSAIGIKNSLLMHLQRPASESDWASILPKDVAYGTRVGDASDQLWIDYQAYLNKRYARIQNKLDADGNATAQVRYGVSDAYDKLGLSFSYHFEMPKDEWVIDKAVLNRPATLTDLANKRISFIVRDEGSGTCSPLTINSRAVDDQMLYFEVLRKNVNVLSGAKDDTIVLGTVEGICVDGGAGEDVIICSNTLSGEKVDLGRFDNVEKVVGTAGSDTVVATDGGEHTYIWQLDGGTLTAAPDSVDFSACSGSASVMIGAGQVRTGSNVDNVVALYAPNAELDVDTGGGFDCFNLGALVSVQMRRDAGTGDYLFRGAGGQRGRVRNAEGLVTGMGNDIIELAGGVAEVLAGEGDDHITIKAGSVLIDGCGGSDSIVVDSGDRAVLVLNQGRDMVSLTANASQTYIGVNAEGTETADDLEKTVDARSMAVGARLMIDVGANGHVKLKSGESGEITINILDATARVTIEDDAGSTASRRIRINYLPGQALDDLALRNGIIDANKTASSTLTNVTWNDVSSISLGEYITYRHNGSTVTLAGSTPTPTPVCGPERSQSSAVWQGVSFCVTDLLGNPVGIDLAALRDEVVAAIGVVAATPQTIGRIGGFLNLQVADLPNGQYAQMTGGTANPTIVLDRTAGGNGWYIDPTPSEFEFFRWEAKTCQDVAMEGSPASGRVDLVSVLWHEIGHLMGAEDLDSGLVGHFMRSEIVPGVRRTPLIDSELLDYYNRKLKVMADRAGYSDCDPFMDLMDAARGHLVTRGVGESDMMTLPDVVVAIDRSDSVVVLPSNAIHSAYTSEELAVKRWALAEQRDAQKAEEARCREVAYSLNYSSTSPQSLGDSVVALRIKYGGHVCLALRPGDLVARGGFDLLRRVGLGEADIAKVVEVLDKQIYLDQAGVGQSGGNAPVWFVTEAAARRLLQAYDQYVSSHPGQPVNTYAKAAIEALRGNLMSMPVGAVGVRFGEESASVFALAGLAKSLGVSLDDNLSGQTTVGLEVEINSDSGALVVSPLSLAASEIPGVQADALMAYYGKYKQKPDTLIVSGTSLSSSAGYVDRQLVAPQWKDWFLTLASQRQFAAADYDNKITALRAYSLEMADGSPLPDWLSFDESTMTLHYSANQGRGNMMLNLVGHGDAGCVKIPFMVKLERSVIGTDSDDLLEDFGLEVPVVLSGKMGNDFYVVRNGGDVVDESSDGHGNGDAGGEDTVCSDVSFDLSASMQTWGKVEHLVLHSDVISVSNVLDMWKKPLRAGSHLMDWAANIDGTGNALDNTISGNAGNNILDGGAGADTLLGGAGNDTYVVDCAGDFVNETAEQLDIKDCGGVDTVMSAIDFTIEVDETSGPGAKKQIAGAIENLTLTGSDPVDGRGNALNNVLIGNRSSNVLRGQGGDDTLIGGGAGGPHQYPQGMLSVDSLDGGEGTDTVVLSGRPDDYSFIAYGAALLVGDRKANRDGLMSLSSVERVSFKEMGGTFSLTGESGPGGHRSLYSPLRPNSVMEYVLSYDDLRELFVNDASGAFLHYAAKGYLEGRSIKFDGLKYIASNSDLMASLGPDREGGVQHAIMWYYGAGESSWRRNDLTMDIQVGDAFDDTLIGAAGNDGLFGDGGDDMLFGAEGDDGLSGGSGADILDGGAGEDQMAGGSGDDIYVVDHAKDIVDERYGSGVDTVRSYLTFALSGGADEETPWFFGDFENLTLEGQGQINGYGSDVANVIVGNASHNVLHGMDGDDFLMGGYGNDALHGDDGNDTMAGGAGDDVYFVGEPGDIVDEAYGADVLGGFGGFDRVECHTTFNLSDRTRVKGLVEALDLKGSRDINAIGNSLNNTLRGNGGANVINGAEGSDEMYGGAGDDTYVVDCAGDAVVEKAEEGVDLVKSAVAYVLTPNVENLTLTGTADLIGKGNGLANLLSGNSGKNSLHGGGGDDTLSGGGGRDTVDGGEGTDTLLLSGKVSEYSFITYNKSLAVGDKVAGRDGLGRVTNVEKVTFLGDGRTLTVEDLPSITARQYIEAYGDLIREIGANTSMGFEHYLNYGYAEGRLTAACPEMFPGGFDALKYLASNADLMAYYGADAAGARQHLISHGLKELAEGGGRSYDPTLLTQVGTAAADTLTGGGDNDGLFGQGGDDALFGGGGNDGLSGGAGNDLLDGGLGVDKMSGGAGDDVYVVDSPFDCVEERYGSGTDTVQSSINFNLGVITRGDIENLSLIGSANIDATGNRLANVLVGNDGANILDGAAGLDMMKGGGGNDVYLIDDKYGDKIVEASGGGFDTLLIDSAEAYFWHDYSLRGGGEDNPEGTAGQDVECLVVTDTVGNDVVLHGNALNNILWGNRWRNTLEGYEGNDILDGAGCNNCLKGGAGNDIYRFDSRGGLDIIVEDDATVGNCDTLYIDAENHKLWFRRSGNDLLIDIMGSNQGSRVTIQNHYAGSQYQVEQIVVRRGMRLAAQDADALVRALASEIQKEGAMSFYDEAMLTQWKAWQPTANAVWVPDATVANLVTAMAQMALPPVGTPMAPPEYQRRIDAIYASNIMN